eukprot:14235906-Alexandrium_andersonii.AAC.1
MASSPGAASACGPPAPGAPPKLMTPGAKAFSKGAPPKQRAEVDTFGRPLDDPRRGLVGDGSE